MPSRSRLLLAAVVSVCALLLLAFPAKAQQADGSRVLTGVFYQVEGLTYQTQTLSGTTSKKGEFRYHPGENVTFSVGGIVLGSAPGNKRLTTAHLVLGVNGDLKKLKVPKATNIARFLQSLDEDNNVDNGITISAATRETVSQYKRKIDFTKKEADFAAQPNVVAVFAKLNKTLRSPAQARNHLRWTLLGIQKASDVKIPMRDGGYLLADIFRPIDGPKVPAIVGLGYYGKAPGRGCICNNKDLLDKEIVLDRYFEGNPDNEAFEVHETADAAYWVPKGYAVVRVDERGLCNVPGVMNPYSVQEAEDFYDSIEWVAKREWANGNVGTWGASLFGINQFSVAQLQPPSLKAMISSAGDGNRYREVVYAGGILNAEARRGWWENMVKPNRCLAQKTYEDTVGNKEAMWLANPFNEPPNFGTYFDKPPLEIDSDLSKVTVPFRSEVPLEHTGAEHVRGAVEGFIAEASTQKQLTIITGDFIAGWMYSQEALPGHVAFFDHFLKGKANNAMNEPRVRMMIRTGDGGWFWQNENEYPVARTEYRKYYLDATPSSFPGDGKRSDFLKLSTTVPATKASKAYSADVKVGSVACYAPGVSFVTEPLTSDAVLAGFIKLGLWVSSTSSDMDIFGSLRVLDANNEEVPYALAPNRGYYPIGKGWQRVSHRKLDPKKSTIYRPWQTDKKADYAPLTSPSEIVQVEVELEPTTAMVKKGQRIRVDIQPVDGCDFGTPHLYDAKYHQGASNTIYTGGDHPSYVQIPVIPPKTAPARTNTEPAPATGSGRMK